MSDGCLQHTHIDLTQRRPQQRNTRLRCLKHTQRCSLRPANADGAHSFRARASGSSAPRQNSRAQTNTRVVASVLVTAEDANTAARCGEHTLRARLRALSRCGRVSQTLVSAGAPAYIKRARHIADITCVFVFVTSTLTILLQQHLINHLKVKQTQNVWTWKGRKS